MLQHQFLSQLLDYLYQIKMHPYVVIKPRQDHIIKPQTRQVSLKIKPNTEMNSKQIEQPRASIAHSQYRQNAKNQEIKEEAELQVPHVININRRVRGFRFQCKDGQIISKKNYQITQKQDLKNPEAYIVKVAQPPKSQQTIIKQQQRQQDEFIFKLEPYHTSAEVIPVTITQNPDKNINTPIQKDNYTSYIQYKIQKPPVIEQIKSNQYIVIENGPSEELIQYKMQKKQSKEKVISKQIKHYQIEQSYMSEYPVQFEKSPDKSKHRHPIFTNPNAEYFEQSVVLANSAAQSSVTAKVDHKYTPIHNISSPPIEKPDVNVYEQSFYVIGNKGSDKSYYLNNQYGRS